MAAKIVFEQFPMRYQSMRRGPGWSFALVSRYAPWWVKARAIRGIRWVTTSTSYWLHWDQP